MPDLLRGIDHQRARRRLQLPAVDREIYQISHYFLCFTQPAPSTSSGRQRARTCRSGASSNSSRNFSTIEIVGIAAASPSAQNVRPSMFFARFADQIDVASRPPPSWKRGSIFLSQVVPSRHGMHQPQLSCA